MTVLLYLLAWRLAYYNGLEAYISSNSIYSSHVEVANTDAAEAMLTSLRANWGVLHVIPSLDGKSNTPQDLNVMLEGAYDSNGPLSADV